MTFQFARDINTNATHYRLIIEDYDILTAKLEPFDFALIKECEASEAIADKLLALETIVRKIEQARGVPQP